MIFVATAQYCQYSRKAATENAYMSGYDLASINFL